MKIFKFLFTYFISAIALSLQAYYINFKYYPDLFGVQYFISNSYIFSLGLLFVSLLLFFKSLYRYFFVFLYLFLTTLVLYYVANTENVAFKLNPLVVRFVLDTNVVESAEVLGSMLSRFDLGNPLFYVCILMIQMYIVVFLTKLMDSQIKKSEANN
jgi:hypothetical protein